MAKFIETFNICLSMMKDNPAQGILCLGFTSFLVVFMLGAAGGILYFFCWGIFASGKERIFHEEEKAFERFLQSLDGLGARQPENPDLFRVLDFPEYSVRLEFGRHGVGKMRRRYIALTARSPVEGNFSICPFEGLPSFVALLIKLGFIGRVNTPDPGFNSRVHVVSEDMNIAGVYLSPAEKQAAVEAIFGEGWGEIRLEGALLTAERDYFSPSAATDTSFITRILGPLATLAK